MKKYLIKLIIYFGLLLTFSFGLSLFFNNYIMQDSVLVKQDRQFKNFSEPLHYLFFGTSHTKNSVNPEIIKNSFNYAWGGESYIMTYYKLKYILENDPKSEDIRFIFLPFEFTSILSREYDRYPPLFYWNKYIDFYELGQEKDDRFGFYLKPMEATFFSFFQNGQFITDFLQKKLRLEKVPEMINGFKPRFKDFSKKKKQLELAETKVKGYFQRSAANDPEMVNYLKRSIDIALQHNKKVVFIKYPVTREYYDMSLKYINNNEFENDLRSEIEENEEVFFLDYCDNYFDQNHLFDNPDHLNFTGSKLFCEKIIEDIKELEFADSQSKQ